MTTVYPLLCYIRPRIQEQTSDRIDDEPQQKIDYQQKVVDMSVECL